MSIMYKDWTLNFYARLKRHYGRAMHKLDRFLETRRPRRTDSPAGSLASTRNVIVHFHNFKSAGTSLDFILQNNFGRHWIEWEEAAEPAALAALLDTFPNLQAVSSHTVTLRLPEVPHIQFFPIVFLRHPIDRVPSVYRFYQKYKRHPGEAAEMARRSDLKSFVEWQLEHGRQFRNYFTERLAHWHTTPEYLRKSELERALQTVSELPFIGLVEDFDTSRVRLEAYLKPHFPGFRGQAVRINSTRRPDGPADRLQDDLRETLGDRIYERLLAANQDDLILYDTVLARPANTR
jgi:hypothetical protein